MISFCHFVNSIAYINIVLIPSNCKTFIIEVNFYGKKSDLNKKIRFKSKKSDFFIFTKTITIYINPASTPPLSFLQAVCRSCCPTNSVKALKATR